MKEKKLKSHLAKLALLGLASGCLIACERPGQKNGNGDGRNSSGRQNSSRPGGGNARTQLSQGAPISSQDQSFYNRLNREGRQAFEQLSPEERSQAINVLEAGCKGKNSCKGLGGGKTDLNDCSGKNQCKGLGGCRVSDPNKAVQMVEKAGEEKQNGGAFGGSRNRNGSNGGNGSNGNSRFY